MKVKDLHGEATGKQPHLKPFFFEQHIPVLLEVACAIQKKIDTAFQEQSDGLNRRNCCIRQFGIVYSRKKSVSLNIKDRGYNAKLYISALIEYIPK